MHLEAASCGSAEERLGLSAVLEPPQAASVIAHAMASASGVRRRGRRLDGLSGVRLAIGVGVGFIGSWWNSG
jgi:hypothetical protein